MAEILENTGSRQVDQREMMFEMHAKPSASSPCMLPVLVYKSTTTFYSRNRQASAFGVKSPRMTVHCRRAMKTLARYLVFSPSRAAHGDAL